jgi:hypothetical protein
MLGCIYRVRLGLSALLLFSLLSFLISDCMILCFDNEFQFVLLFFLDIRGVVLVRFSCLSCFLLISFISSFAVALLQGTLISTRAFFVSMGLDVASRGWGRGPKGGHEKGRSWDLTGPNIVLLDCIH